MTDKISPISPYTVESPPVGPRQQPLLLMAQMPPDQVILSTQKEGQAKEKSSLTSIVGSFFKSMALSLNRFMNKVLGRKETSGIVSYFDGDPDKAIKYLKEGMQAQSQGDLNRIAMNAAASTEENKKLAKELHEVEKLPGKTEIEKILATGQDPAMQEVENTIGESLKKSQERRENL